MEKLNIMLISAIILIILVIGGGIVITGGNVQTSEYSFSWKGIEWYCQSKIDTKSCTADSFDDGKSNCGNPDMTSTIEVTPKETLVISLKLRNSLPQGISSSVQCVPDIDLQNTKQVKFPLKGYIDINGVVDSSYIRSNFAGLLTDLSRDGLTQDSKGLSDVTIERLDESRWIIKDALNQKQGELSEIRISVSTNLEDAATVSRTEGRIEILDVIIECRDGFSFGDEGCNQDISYLNWIIGIIIVAVIITIVVLIRRKK